MGCAELMSVHRPKQARGQALPCPSIHKTSSATTGIDVIKLKPATVLWIALYILVLCAPLLGGVLNLAHGRGFWLNFSVALGFVALSMMGGQFVLVSRMQWVTRPMGMNALLVFHKRMAYVATVFALVHPIILLASDEKYWSLLNVLTSPLRAKFAVSAAVALVLLVIFSIYRRQLHMSYRLWQLLHWLLAMVVVGASFAHVLLVNYYLRDHWQQVVWTLLSILFVLLLVTVRVIKPWMRYRQKWQVWRVYPDVVGATHIVLKLHNPAAYGPSGFRFRAGQFAWVSAWRSPFALTYNPFSIDSSALSRDTLSFTVRSHGGFSADVPKLQVGQAVYVDGPHGTFCLDDDASGPLVLIGAGVGVTPLLSMLETLADRGSKRHCHLWLANKDAFAIAGGRRIDALCDRLPLDVIHVFSKPRTGKVQRLDRAFLVSHLPQDFQQASFYICGPTALMDMAELVLNEVGVPSQQVHTERFEMV